MTKFDSLINGDRPVLVDFFATWCGPCKTMAPILEQLKQMMGDAVSIIKVDVDKNQEVSQKYAISGVPTLMVFQRGEIKWKQSGVVPAHQLKQVLSALL